MTLIITRSTYSPISLIGTERRNLITKFTQNLLKVFLNHQKSSLDAYVRRVGRGGLNFVIWEVFMIIHDNLIAEFEY